MKPNTLNIFSSLIYDLLIKAYPQWSNLIRVADDDNRSIILEVSSPKSPELFLEVSTYDEEITVSYGNFHSHFGWSNVPGEESFRQAQEMINEIITDQILIAEYSKDGEVYQAETLQKEELEQYLEFCSEVKIIGWNKEY